MNTDVIYVLECAHGKYYVGKCSSVRLSERIVEHQTGQGAVFTDVHPPKRLVHSHLCTGPFDEDNTVLEWMRKYGLDNVRGGTYSQIVLPQHHVVSINQQLAHADGKCIKCGGEHFALECVTGSKQKFACTTQRAADEHCIDDACYRCGRLGHFSSECFASKHANGQRLQGNFVSNNCFRCGRTGHFANECYASRHVKGYFM
jgi:hypothetical protein